MQRSAGRRFRGALGEEKSLQIVGVPNALVALIAERIGFRAPYLSSAGMANLCYGLRRGAYDRPQIQGLFRERRRLEDLAVPELIELFL